MFVGGDRDGVLDGRHQVRADRDGHGDLESDDDGEGDGDRGHAAAQDEPDGDAESDGEDGVADRDEAPGAEHQRIEPREAERPRPR